MNKEGISLKVDDIKLVGQLYLPSLKGGKKHPALCICHGIPAGPPDPSDRGYPLLAERCCAQGFLVLIFNFRGTGESKGNFDILGWCRDLEAAIDYLYQLKEVDSSRFSLMGFSGGAAVAVYVAAEDERVSSVVACACPAEFAASKGYEELLEQSRQVGIIRDSNFPPSREEWAQGFRIVSPLKCVHKISPRPLLVIHGDEDELIAVSEARRLYQRAGEPKDIFIVKGGHRLRLNEKAMAAAIAWLKRVNGLTG
jgi:dipeptidyl aminopeptidase/acylaminoacyl peptidase